MIYSMTQIAPTIAAILGVRPPAGAEDPPIAALVERLRGAHRLAIIAVDALGISTLDAHPGAAPTLDRIGAKGRMIVRSVLPAITPVNFATMATGAPPSIHGIGKRTDPLPLETIFHTVRATGRKTAAIARAVSSVGILLSRFTDYPALSTNNRDDEVLSLARGLALVEKPELMLVHFLDVDDVSHAFGPGSPENRAALAASDGRVNALLPHLAASGYALIVLADHGQHRAEPEDHDDEHVGTHSGRVEADVLVPLISARPEELSIGLLRPPIEV